MRSRKRRERFMVRLGVIESGVHGMKATGIRMSKSIELALLCDSCGAGCELLVVEVLRLSSDAAAVVTWLYSSCYAEVGHNLSTLTGHARSFASSQTVL